MKIKFEYYAVRPAHLDVEDKDMLEVSSSGTGIICFFATLDGAGCGNVGTRCGTAACAGHCGYARTRRGSHVYSYAYRVQWSTYERMLSSHRAMNGTRPRMQIADRCRPTGGTTLSAGGSAARISVSTDVGSSTQLAVTAAAIQRLPVLGIPTRA